MWIDQDAYGNADVSDLEEKLQDYSKTGRQLIGAFSAASNITGVLTDTDAISVLLHRYGALAFWDYATAGQTRLHSLPKGYVTFCDCSIFCSSLRQDGHESSDSDVSVQPASLCHGREWGIFLSNA